MMHQGNNSVLRWKAISSRSVWGRGMQQDGGMLAYRSHEFDVDVSGRRIPLSCRMERSVIMCRPHSDASLPGTTSCKDRTGRVDQRLEFCYPVIVSELNLPSFERDDHHREY